MAEESTVLLDGDGPEAATLTEDARALLRLVAQRPECDDFEGPLELSVVLMDDATIRPLNKQWRNKDEATDVLSFPLEEGPILGDVVISVETARRRLNDEWNLGDELLFLLIHGVLHLLGHDHLEGDEQAVMEAAEQALWTAMGRPGTLRASDGS
ncbi:MAG: rRNA maturation RNase YbeY [Proteobacteria bacterium]|nr:rRNA maturation RNase YbeY [Pseudomonadota bacterium]